jgi:sugar lactone lactonase YvrE
MSLGLADSLSLMTVLMEGISFGESPRWHDGRVWFSDWGAHQVIALDPQGGHEVVVSVESFPMCHLGGQSGVDDAVDLCDSR